MRLNIFRLGVRNFGRFGNAIFYLSLNLYWNPDNMYVTPLKYAQRQEVRQISRQGKKKKKTCPFFIYRGELFIAKEALIPKWIVVQKKQNKTKQNNKNKRKTRLV